MQGRNALVTILRVLGLLAVSQRAWTEEQAAPGTVQVHVVITDEALQSDKELPSFRSEYVTVNKGSLS
jgi:hypothetical protein